MILKFIEFLDEGTFVGIRLDKDSQARIKAFQDAHNINNPVSGKDLHVTVIYSKKTMPDIKVDGNLDASYIATIRKFENYNGALVGVLDCPNLEMKHTELLNRYKGTHDYDSYSPHVTFAYGFEGDIDSLPAFQGDIKLVTEYVETAK